MRAQNIEHFRDPLPTFASLADELKSVAFGNKSTIVERRGGVDFLFNEFWTARQRQANRLHEISYRACFKPQLPEFFISRLTRVGETVYDPFMGRGTTLLQAALMGRRALGNDINPLSRMLIRPRLNPPTLEAIAERLREIDWKYAGALQSDLLVFFHERTLAEIHALREWFFSREAGGEFDPVDDWLRMTAISRLTGHSSGFFSVYTLPPNQAVSIEAQRKINRSRDQSPPERDVATILLRKSRNLLSMPKPLRMRDEASLLLAGSAEATPAIETGSVDLVVTSPPFLDVVQYAADNWLRCWFAGIDPAGVPIAMHKRPQDWTAFVRRTFAELARIVRAGGHVAFEVGEVRNGAIELDELVLNAAAGLPFEPLCVLVNVQEFTKTAHCWGVGNNTKGTNTNRVVVLRRMTDRPERDCANGVTPL
jgi:hypothetical protein